MTKRRASTWSARRKLSSRAWSVMRKGLPITESTGALSGATSFEKHRELRMKAVVDQRAVTQEATAFQLRDDRIHISVAMPSCRQTLRSALGKSVATIEPG